MTIRIERRITRGPNDHRGRHYRVYSCQITRATCVGLFCNKKEWTNDISSAGG